MKTLCINTLIFCLALLATACNDLTGVSPDAAPEATYRVGVLVEEAPALLAGTDEAGIDRLKVRDEPRDDYPFFVITTPEAPDHNPADFSASIMDTDNFSMTVRLMARVHDGNLYYCRRRLQNSHPETIGIFNGRNKETLAELSSLTEQVRTISASSWVEYWLEDDGRTVVSPRIRLPLPGNKRQR